MDQEVAHFNEMLLDLLLVDAEKHILKTACVFQVDGRALSILRTVPPEKLRAVACQSGVALVVPSISEADLQSGNLGTNQQFPLSDDYKHLNLEYLLLVKQAAREDLPSCMLKLSVPPDLATSITRLSSSAIRKLADSSTKLFMRLAINTELARTYQQCAPNILPFLTALSSGRRVSL